MCLLRQVQKTSGPVVSICMSYVRNGKLLNCSLLSPDRIVPDIYTLNQGIGGNPVDIFIHLKRLHIAQDMHDPKAVMMENYKEKNDLMLKWDRQTAAHGQKLLDPGSTWMLQFTIIKSNYAECILYQIGHAAMMTICALISNYMRAQLLSFLFLFCMVAGSHTIGWILNSSSMESVPFETGIKSVISAWARWANTKSKAPVPHKNGLLE